MPRLAPGTAQSEFTIMCSAAAYMDANPEAPGDNLGYAVFGQVLEGMDVVRAIHAKETTGTTQNAVMNGEIIDRRLSFSARGGCRPDMPPESSFSPSSANRDRLVDGSAKGRGLWPPT